MTEIKMHVSFAWWLKPYLFVLAACCMIAQREPDQSKLEATIKRAMRVTVR